MNFQLLISALTLCVTSAAVVNDKIYFTALEVLSKSSDKFSTNLFKLLSSEKENENLICSPLSAHVVLSMAAFGAQGYTAWTMRQALKLPANTSFALLGFQSLVEDFNSTKKVDLQIASRIYVAKTLKIKNGFKELTSKSFMAEAMAMDTSNPAKVVKEVNDWVDEKTHHKITNILDKDDIDESTRMVLLNVLYFKGKWANKFNQNFTANLPFHVAKDKQIAVPMMRINETFVHGRLDDLKAQFVEIPYENKDLKMVIIVPDEKDGLIEIEQSLENFDYKNAVKKAERRLVRLSMPKFKIESNIELNKPLKLLGMVNMFGNSANFKGISDEGLKVDQVKQKAFIEVNEEGSEAAAVTAMIIMVKAFFYEPTPVVLNVDRPFYFMIRKSDVTLFQGHVYDPLK